MRISDWSSDVCSSDLAHQIAGLVDPVVEDRVVAAVRLSGIAHQEGYLVVVVGHPARLAADAERFPDDQLGAALGVFTHDADVIAVGDLLREAVVDLAALLRCGQSAMQRADPLLLDRHCVDAGHLQLLLRQRRLAEKAGHGKGREREATPCQSRRSEEHTSELQSLMRLKYAVFCLTKKTLYRHNYNET